MKDGEIRALVTLAFILLAVRLDELKNSPRTVIQYSEKQPANGKQSG